MASPEPRPETIDKLANAVYPSFAMLAGMQLDLFTPHKNGPLTTESIATGTPQAKVDFATMSEAELESFYRGTHSGTVANARAPVARYDFSSYRNLLDVGGGTGGLAITLTTLCPGLRATVVDLPTVTPIAHRFIEEAGAADRVEVVNGDAVNGPLTGSFDVAVMRALVQVLSREQALLAIRNVGRVVKPGGEVYVSGFVLDNSSLSPGQAVGFNLFTLNIYDEGGAYTEQEHRDWLTQAGFENIEREAFPDGTSIIRARKPG